MVKIQELRTCSLLKDFSEEELKQFSEYVELVAFTPDEVIFDEFEPSECFYLLKEGKVGIYRSDAFGRWVKIAAVYSGTPLGECAFFLRSSHSLRAVAETPVKAFEISRKSIEQIRDKNPKLLIKFMEIILSILSDRLKTEDRRFSNLCGFFSVPGGGRWKR